MVHLTIYGVFDRRADRCVKVGSTIKPLGVRAKQYRSYKWFDATLYEHKSLSECNVHNECDLQFFRAAKEAMWIGRMRTWWDQGGMNRMNPVLHALRNPQFFTEWSSAGGRASGKVGDLSRREHLARIGKLGSHADKVRAGVSGRGKAKARKPSAVRLERLRAALVGKPRSREFKERLRNHPANRAGGILTNHRRWHVARGIANPECPLCRPDFFDVVESQHLIQEAA